MESIPRLGKRRARYESQGSLKGDSAHSDIGLNSQLVMLNDTLRREAVFEGRMAAIKTLARDLVHNLTQAELAYFASQFRSEVAGKYGNPQSSSTQQGERVFDLDLLKKLWNGLNTYFPNLSRRIENIGIEILDFLAGKLSDMDSSDHPHEL